VIYSAGTGRLHTNKHREKTIDQHIAGICVWLIPFVPCSAWIVCIAV